MKYAKRKIYEDDNTKQANLLFQHSLFKNNSNKNLGFLKVIINIKVYMKVLVPYKDKEWKLQEIITS
jgi:hypothetical protein